MTRNLKKTKQSKLAIAYWRDEETPLSVTLGDIWVWITITAIIMLVTVELTSPNYNRINLLINRRKLRNLSYVFSIVFLIALAIIFT